MSVVLKQMQLGADDREDMVVIQLGNLRPMAPYQLAFEIAQRIKVNSRMTAAADRVPASFDREMAQIDLEDCPKAHRGFRRSKLVQNFDSWKVGQTNDGLVRIWFDDIATDIGYADGIKMAYLIRRAGHRAKAWAGDTNRGATMLGGLQDGEELYRLGLN